MLPPYVLKNKYPDITLSEKRIVVENVKKEHDKCHFFSKMLAKIMEFYYRKIDDARYLRNY